jgi:hypothetical protein
VPGLSEEVGLLAWQHRQCQQSPLILVIAPHGEVHGNELQIMMIPRILWDKEPRFMDVFSRECLRNMFGASSFCPNRQYIRALVIPTIVTEGARMQSSCTLSTCDFDLEVIRGAAIVDALTAGLRFEDLEAAFTWLEKREQSGFSPESSAAALSLHANTPPLELRGIHNEFAFNIMRRLGLEFGIRLTGLSSAAHLNGKEGVLRGSDPMNPSRSKARLDDGTIVSVRFVNFVYIRHGDYKRSAVECPAGNF